MHSLQRLARATHKVVIRLGGLEKHGGLSSEWKDLKKFKRAETILAILV
jgi:hypothetical protein